MSAVTVGELQAGIEITRKQDAVKAKEIELWLDGVEQSYGVLPADAAIFRRWAQLMHRRPDHHLEDALIAATALVRGLTVVTRNVDDFERLRRSLDQSVHLASAVHASPFRLLRVPAPMAPAKRTTRRFHSRCGLHLPHQTCTVKMGRDSMSVVDGQLKVYGVENLRIAYGSIMPRVTTGNTMAPCIIIGERAGQMLQAEHRS